MVNVSGHRIGTGEVERALAAGRGADACGESGEVSFGEGPRADDVAFAGEHEHAQRVVAGEWLIDKRGVHRKVDQTDLPVRQALGFGPHPFRRRSAVR